MPQLSVKTAWHGGRHNLLYHVPIAWYCGGVSSLDEFSCHANENLRRNI